MAFQRFHNEPYYADPGVDILNEGLQRAAQNLGQFFSSIATRETAKRKAADQFKFDIGNRKFENDDRIIREQAFNAVELAKQDIRKYGRLTPQTEKRLQQVQLDANASDIQFKSTEDLIKRMDKRATEDKYYDPTEDEKLIRKATHGDNNDINYFTRGNNLNEVQKVFGQNPKSFRINDYTADYVADVGIKEKTTSTANPNAVNSRYSSSPFWDPATGAPGVTDQHAVNYLKSRPDGSVQRFIQSEVDDELNGEIKQMKSSGDPKNEWMKGKSDAEIKDALIRDPSKNTINQTDFGVRVRDKAKTRLEDAADIKSKVDVEYKKDLSKTGGLYNNDSIAYSPTFNAATVEVEPAPIIAGKDGSTVVSSRNPVTKAVNAAPGGILMINKGTTTGKPITFESTSRNIYNINTGSYQQAKGSSTFNLTGYQLQAYDRNGRPFMFDATNPRELKEKIRSMPLSSFANLEPSMSIALNGYSVNKAKMLGDIRTSTYETSLELAKAKADGDIMKQQTLEAKIMEMEDFRRQLNMDSNEFTDDDVLNAAARSGITQIRTDQLVKADKADLDKINSITEGLNLNKQDKWSPEMREVNELYKQRYAEAQAAGFMDKKTRTTKPKAATSVPTGNIKVKSPSGQIGYIPASQEKDALAQGYTKVN